jgi:hypothetical protein
MPCFVPSPQARKGRLDKRFLRDRQLPEGQEAYRSAVVPGWIGVRSGSDPLPHAAARVKAARRHLLFRPCCVVAPARQPASCLRPPAVPLAVPLAAVK